MSEIKVDTLTGKTSAGDVTITSEGGAVTMQLQQGVAKNWINFTGTSTVTTNDSLNASSVTDSGTGLYIPSITNAMSNANYSYNYMLQRAATNDVIFVTQKQSVNPTTTTYNTRTFHVDHDTAPTAEDADIVCCAIHGDLA